LISIPINITKGNNHINIGKPMLICLSIHIPNKYADEQAPRPAVWHNRHIASGHFFLFFFHEDQSLDGSFLGSAAGTVSSCDGVLPINTFFTPSRYCSL
jgi:hypothetical protein